MMACRSSITAVLLLLATCNSILAAADESFSVSLAGRRSAAAVNGSDPHDRSYASAEAQQRRLDVDVDVDIGAGQQGRDAGDAAPRRNDTVGHGGDGVYVVRRMRKTGGARIGRYGQPDPSSTEVVANEVRDVGRPRPGKSRHRQRDADQGQDRDAAAVGNDTSAVRRVPGDDVGYGDAAVDVAGDAAARSQVLLTPAAQQGVDSPQPAAAGNVQEGSSANRRSDVHVTRVKAQEGGTASLNCEVDTVGEGMVSWTRQRDYYVLTVGSKTLTKDDRFIPTRSRSSKIWSLKIKFVNSSDSGWYECQISTHPPKMRLLHLTVVKAKAVMKPGKEIYVKEGSSVSLTCEVQNVINSAKHVFWYHGEKMIADDDEGSGRDMRIITDNNSSLLELRNIGVGDSGNYTCSPLLAMPASVMLHVLGGGENPAAMQDGASSTGSSGPGIRASLFCSAILVHNFFAHILLLREGERNVSLAVCLIFSMLIQR